MDQMFTIPHNILLVIGAGIVLATIGFVIFTALSKAGRTSCRTMIR